MVNGDIRSSEVLLVDENGKNLGKTSTSIALAKARDVQMDLVHVGGTSLLPVCKIADYGKMRYESSKNKPSKKQDHVKEMMFKLRIDDHDLEIKKKKIRSFISKSMKVKFGVTLMRRERSFKKEAKEKLDKHVEDLLDVAKIDDTKINDLSVVVMLSPL